MRTEPCICGGCITAPSLAASGPYVEAHNGTLLHRVWRSLEGIHSIAPTVDPQLLRELLPSGDGYRDPRRPTAGATPVDPVQGDSGASASEGAA